MDIAKANRIVSNWVTKPITPWQFEVLVNYVMERGAEAFKRSTMLKKINRGDMKGAIEELPSLAEVAEVSVTSLSL
jgi:lysozyme